MMFSCSGDITGGAFVLDLFAQEHDSVAVAVNWLISALRSSTAGMIWAPHQLSFFVKNDVHAASTRKVLGLGGVGGNGGISSERRTMRLLLLLLPRV